MQTITIVGLDIAKSVFQVHCVDADGEVVLRRQSRPVLRHIIARVNFRRSDTPCA
jgi:transposase